MKRLLFIPAILVAASAAFAKDAVTGMLIFPAQDKHCHGSSIVELANGDFLACWFHGSGERSANDVQIRGARLKKGAAQWSDVFVMADTPGLPDCNPVLYIDAKDRLWLFWIVPRANRWERSVLKYRRAEDFLGDGPPKWSWQDIIIMTPGDDFPDKIAAGFKAMNFDVSMWGEFAPPYDQLVIDAAKDKANRQEGWMTRIHPLTLSTGRILLPLYSDGFNLSLAAISDDVGETWRASDPIVGLGPIQPTFVEKKDGSVAAFFRDSGEPPGRIQHATSSDGGQTWTPTHDISIPNPSSSLEVVKLKSGEWALICNDTEEGRHRLLLALSTDEGKTWRYGRYLESAERGDGSYAYPSMLEGSDGLLHMTYTWNEREGKSIKYAVVDPAWIKKSRLKRY